MAKYKQKEEERLAALYELEILDTPPEERFDRIVRLAIGILRVSVGYIAFLDSKRQWFKAKCGFTVKETSRRTSICQFTIKKNEPLIIPDISLDEKFASKATALGKAFPMRFYAGIPLSFAGLKVGTLCVADQKPRELQDKEIELLNELAKQVEDQLALVAITKLKRSLRETNIALNQAKEQLEMRNKLIIKIFRSYMSDEVVNKILTAPNQIKLGGEKRKVTILFSDLRDFTSIAASIAPEKLVELLNYYFSCMVSIIEKHNGVINAFIGDAIMVIFGAPYESKNDALSAIACAIEMQLALKKINTHNMKKSLPNLTMGIGINTGIAVIGNIGSEKRKQYTAIGSAVNLSSRIQALTLGGQVLISETTRYEGGNLVKISGHLRVKIKGFNTPIKIYEVVGVSFMDKQGQLRTLVNKVL
ncbi:adenylate/guanylate cyclase domain-containing protein (plasmid) [Legionella sp. D16C41]|uniref:adenylate/guanylate cyclase domain-containing protein n=1 Tax=Legionella sp. D16C41 TaxID=3402688 RepID=UPI003AF4D3AD